MSARCGNNAMAMAPTRFFKIILKTNLQRLKIPNKFTRRFGGALSNPVFLKPPDGTQWKVCWTKENVHEVWFQKGWKEFTQNYSLDHGHLVVFKYKGTSQFDVFILDQSGLEIDYPLSNNFGGDDEKYNLDDESLQILEEILPRKKSRQKLVSLCSPQPLLKRRGEKGSQRTSSLNWPKEPRAQEVAQNFISDNPFFTLFIKRTHLANHLVWVPSLEGYVENKVKNVKLHVGKRSWQVKMLLNHTSSSSRRLSAGWNLFAQENELQPEDVCVFELINRKGSVFKVHVFKKRNLDDEIEDKSVQMLEEIRPHKKARQKLPFSCPQPLKIMPGEKVTRRTSSLNWPKDLRAQEVAQSFISCNPFFTMLVKPTYLADRQANVPSLYGYIENEVKNVTLMIGKRMWQVKMLRCYNPVSRRLSGGWDSFAQENGLQPEDVCVFELINRKSLVFKVHVFKRA